ncbi:alpha/beta fold hydrolase [Actinomadura hibisca]|uniref:alpha/beta fold hydrolase n=1 Tax=Actinomadura hibisca TaxID=68565 RepID=UPI000831EFD3|nr:alpha/beta hydrolase [Actinomadura hibisca]
MAILRANGRDLSYSDSGGDGPAIVLAHGYFLDGTMFQGQADGLAPGHRVVTWDARGHGGTPDDGVPFTYWDSARDLLGLMDALDIATATVGGVSQGGFISLRAALLAPERIDRLVLFDTESHPCDPGDKVAYQGLFDALAANGPVEELVTGLAAQLIGDHPAAADWVRKWQAAPHLPLGTPVACLLERDDVTGQLAEITCPALLVRGSEDRSIPAERMRALREGLPGATDVQIVEGAAHSPPITHPKEVNDLLARFLAGELT